MRNRVELAKYLSDKGFNKGAEVGVYTGYYSKVLCEAMPGLDLTCVDIWGKGKYKLAEDMCLELLEPYNVTIIKKYSVDGAKDVPDGSLDFVYIDAAHDYENVKKDLEAWVPKVRIGGVVSGDDFYEFPSGKGGVMPAVTEFTSKNRYNLKLTDWNEDNPIRDDRQPSFYFEKTH